MERGIRETLYTDGIKVKISRYFEEVAVGLDQKGLVAALVEMTGLFMSLN
jgi:hypothetical protein